MIATGLAALVSSVRRVSEYSSSFLDLKDYTCEDIGCTQSAQRDDGPKETANTKEHAINRLMPKSFRQYGCVL